MRQAPPGSSSTVSPNPLLLSAAVAGLLCLATVSCTTEKEPPAGPGVITSSETVDPFSVDDFTAKCDARGGMVEVIPECSGRASAKGFSYDVGTKQLSEHTCKGANTCAGWNCSIPDA